MKTLNIIWVALLTLFITSCAKDDTNLNYTPWEEITVTGIESAYTKISGTDRITLSPTATSNKPGAKFEYLWGIYETNVTGYAPVLDTLAKTKDLDYLVKQPAKGWVLVFRVTNITTGYSVYIKSAIDVATQFTRGWYVAKDDGSKADLDLFLTPQTIVPEGKLEDIYSKVNGKTLDGKATFLYFTPTYQSDATGIFGNTRTLFLLAERDMAPININTLKDIHTFNDLFYETPSVKAPSMVAFNTGAGRMTNNGQAYSTSSKGIFSGGKLKDEKNTPYNLSKYFLYYRGNTLCFDNMSSSFVASPTGITLTSLTDDVGTAMPSNNNNKTMLFMGFKSVTMPDWGYAVFQDKTDPSLKTLSKVGFATFTSGKITVGNETIKTTDKLYNATKYMVLDGDENMMFFVVGNQVWSRNLTNKFEQLQFTADPGEEITFIRHKKYSISAEVTYIHNYVAIGTSQGGNYKVRMFTKTAGNLNSTPAFTITGKGFARDIVYVSPVVSDITYNPSY